MPGARDVAVQFFTLSKSYNMAGWRIGFMVGNKTLVSALARIKSHHDYGTLYAVAGGGDCGTRGRSTVRARHCRTVQTTP
ncbi:aminotransferase class I/II-fold pyridoxal phosphate-dependent enzyme [Shigella flexneri]